MLLGPLLQAELFTLLEHEHLQEAAILIMANKQDLKDAMNVKEMTDVLSLHSLKRHDWHIQVTASVLRSALIRRARVTKYPMLQNMLKRTKQGFHSIL